MRAVAYGHLTTSPEAPLSERLAELLGDLEKLISEVAPDVVVVERVLFQANARTAMSVGQASGLALAAAAAAGCEVVQYSPNEVKQAIAGYGSATKEQVQRMVQVLLDLGRPPRPADRADALALAVCHLAGSRLRTGAGAALSRQVASGPAAGARQGGLPSSGPRAVGGRR